MATRVAQYIPTDNNMSGWDHEPGLTGKITERAAGTYMERTGTYVRARLKMPEKLKMVMRPAEQPIYLSGRFMFPQDFLARSTSYKRLLGTDNFGATLNGAPVGCFNGNEWRVGLTLYSDDTAYLLSTHQGGSTSTLWKGNPSLLKLSGERELAVLFDVPAQHWAVLVDGTVIAEGSPPDGNPMIPTTVPTSERVVTRVYCGMDGADPRQSSPVSLTVYGMELWDGIPSEEPPHPDSDAEEIARLQAEVTRLAGELTTAKLALDAVTLKYDTLDRAVQAGVSEFNRIIGA